MINHLYCGFYFWLSIYTKEGGEINMRKVKIMLLYEQLHKFAFDCAHLLNRLALKSLTQSHDLTILKTDLVLQQISVSDRCL